MNKKEAVKIKEQVNELLNQALILMQNVPSPQMRDDDYDYSYQPVGGSSHRDSLSWGDDSEEELAEKLKDLPAEEVVYLGCTKEMVEKLISGRSEDVWSQYYNSTC